MKNVKSNRGFLSVQLFPVTWFTQGAPARIVMLALLSIYRTWRLTLPLRWLRALLAFLVGAGGTGVCGHSAFGVLTIRPPAHPLSCT